MADEKLYDLIAELVGNDSSSAESLGQTGQRPEPEAPPIQQPPRESGPKPSGKSLTESLESIGKTAKETGGAAKDFAESDFGRGAMIAASGLAAVGAAAIAIPTVIKGWSESLVEGKRGLMAFNGAIAGVILRAEQRQIERKIESGTRTSGTTRFLSDGLESLKDEIQPFRDFVSNAIAIPLGVIIRGISLGVKMLSYLPPIWVVLKAQELITSNGQKDTAFQKWNDQVKAGALERPPEDQ